jgi:hypothetical protein
MTETTTRTPREHADALRHIQGLIDEAWLRNPCQCRGQCSDCSPLERAERLMEAMANNAEEKAKAKDEATAI